MKVLLTGTIYTGKTSVLKLLRDLNLPNVYIIPEFAREILSKHPELEHSSILQDVLFAEQVKMETFFEEKGGITFCDRGSSDMVAHSRLFGHEVKEDWVSWTRTYDSILFFDKEGIPFFGENRAFVNTERDWVSFRNDLDKHIRLSLADYNIVHDKILGSLKARFDVLCVYVRSIPTVY